MANPDRDYFEFYLHGRDDAQDDLEDREIDYAKLGAAVVAGESIREVAEGASRKEKLQCGDVVAWRKSSRRRRQDIDAAGGDNARAYRLYCQGYTDELAHGIEAEILNAIAEDDGDETEDEDEGDDNEIEDEKSDD